MGRVSTKRKHILRQNLWVLQGGNCFWCNVPLSEEDWSDRYRTFAHLDERDSPNKNRFNGKKVRRIVLACWCCNNDRANYSLEHRLMMADQATWSLTKLEAA